MKTNEPLQGFIVSSNHEIVHLALLIAQLASHYYFIKSPNGFGCQDDPEEKKQTNLFLICHATCFGTQLIGHFLEKWHVYELSKVFGIVRVPFYIIVIYKAHYFELTNLYDKAVGMCESNQKSPNFISQWFIIELRVFYGYILSGILFIMLAQCIGMDKSEASKIRKPEGYDENTLDKQIEDLKKNKATNSHKDFIEKYKHAQVDFSLHSFELISTIIMIVEFYYHGKGVVFEGRSGSYLPSMIVLIVYGVVTLLQGLLKFNIFCKDQKSEKIAETENENSQNHSNLKEKIYWRIYPVRTALMIASITLMFTQDGKQIKWGLWVMTNFVVFLVHSLWEVVKLLLKKYTPKFWEKDAISREEVDQKLKIVKSVKDKTAYDPKNVEIKVEVSQTSQNVRPDKHELDVVTKPEDVKLEIRDTYVSDANIDEGVSVNYQNHHGKPFVPIPQPPLEDELPIPSTSRFLISNNNHLITPHKQIQNVAVTEQKQVENQTNNENEVAHKKKDESQKEKDQHNKENHQHVNGGKGHTHEESIWDFDPETNKLRKKLQLKEDFYAVAFISMKEDVIAEYKISRQHQARNFYSCLWILMIELTLIALIFKEVYFDVDHFDIYTDSPWIYLTRFLTTILLHMELIEDVKQGLNMMKFLNSHQDQFISTSPMIPFLIGFMQAFGGFMAEITNLLMLASRQKIAECITFFVAFHVLQKVDNIYAESISDFKLLHATEHPILITGDLESVFSKKQTSLEHRFIRIVYGVLSFLYNSIYFYFLPFLVNFIPYFAPGDPSKKATGGH